MEPSPRDGTNAVFSRRSALAFGARVLSLAIPVYALTAPGAAASVRWCRSDPLVAIDGELADIFVAAPIEAPLTVTGPTEIVVTVPKREVSAELILATLGFGRGEKVTFAESSRLKVTDAGIQVQIDVFVPASDDAMPVRVEFAPRIIGILSPASAEGVANTWVTLRTEF